jgi:hypothetical protein
MYQQSNLSTTPQIPLLDIDSREMNTYITHKLLIYKQICTVEVTWVCEFWTRMSEITEVIDHI